MEKKLQSFEYEGKRITFDFGDGQKMVNATQMVKAFKGKRINNFLRSKQTKEFIKVLESRYAKKRNGNEYKAYRVIKGGTPELQGTWMDEKLALKFAAFLNPYFELWVYDRIHELLTQGMINEKYLKWVLQKIQDNAQENFNLANLNQIKGIADAEED